MSNEKSASVRTLFDIMKKPKDEAELNATVDEQHRKYIEFILENWKRVGEIVGQQNILVNKFLNREEKKLAYENQKFSRRLSYTVKGLYRGEKEINSIQQWLPERYDEPLLGGMLSYLWQWEFVDMMHISIVKQQWHQVNVDGRERRFFIYEYPMGGLKINSKGLQKSLGISLPVDLDLVPHSSDEALKTAIYFKDYTAKLLDRPGTVVIQK